MQWDARKNKKMKKKKSCLGMMLKGDAGLKGRGVRRGEVGGRVSWRGET